MPKKISRVENVEEKWRRENAKVKCKAGMYIFRNTSSPGGNIC
jgi:hypothetical protein